VNPPDTPAALVVGMREALTAVADPTRAPAMEAYLKDRFPFLGVPSPVRRAAVQPLTRTARSWGQAAVLEVAERLWSEPEREFQLVGVDVVRAGSPRWDADALPAVRALVQSKSWWDTVDGLAHSVGDLVLAHPGLAREMDRWIDDDDLWVARVALIHQLGWKERADEARLFHYCARRAGDREFFIRKAIGWALRDHARVGPDEVRRFVAAHPELSGLSRREALKHLGSE
jgi:3-methyladenine DNA glycosylase AlkD